MFYEVVVFFHVFFGPKPIRVYAENKEMAKKAVMQMGFTEKEIISIKPAKDLINNNNGTPENHDLPHLNRGKSLS